MATKKKKKYFGDPEVCDGEIEGDSYSWIGEINEMT